MGGSAMEIVGAVAIVVVGAVVVTAFDYATHDLEYV